MSGQVRALADRARGARWVKPAVLALLCLMLALAALFDRTWRFGEVLSPADAIFQFYPWAYDAPNTPPSNLSRTDEAFFHQPLVRTHWPRLLAGDWPDLDPLVLAGVPGFFQGLSVGQALSPVSLPLYVTPDGHGETLYAVLRLLCAGLFMFAFLRARRCGTAGAVAGALAFALSGPFIIWLSAPMPTVALWLPLAWLFVDRVYDHRGVRDAAGLALVLAGLWLGAYLPTALACGAAVGAYAAARLIETRLWRPGALVVASAIGSVVIAAAGLMPMLATLVASPAAARSMPNAHPPLDVLVTFALPDFFGNPAHHTWWRPGPVSYPELVSYLGVATLVFAGAGLLARGCRAEAWRRWFFAGLALATLGLMYGWPLIDWVSALPGFRQTNPMRWNVVLAASTAVIAAYGVDWLARPGPDVWRPCLAGVFAAGCMAVVAAVVLLEYRPTIRNLGLQELAWQQLGRFVIVAAGALAVVLAGAWRARACPERALGPPAALTWVALLLIAADLVTFGRGFNPTLRPERLYPDAPALSFLTREIGGGRVAPVGADGRLLQGHVFSVYGVPVVTGFDFRGDAAYQRFLARADGNRSFAGPVWDHVELQAPARLDLRLLGLLGAKLVVTAPLDVAPTPGPFVPLPDLVDGRHVGQEFTARQDGLRRVDVLMATHRRPNTGSVTIRLRDDAGRILAGRTEAAARLRDNDWLTLDVPPVADAAGRRFTIELLAAGASAGAAPTAWAVPQTGPVDAPVSIDGRTINRVLWFRAFGATARLGDAMLIYARDLNIYRNPHARPRAWFVSAVETAAPDVHLERMAAPGFDTARMALVAAPLSVGATTTARVRAIDVHGGDRREVAVEAPDGGVLVVGERAAPGWTATVDGRPVPLVRADSVIMALAVPPGSQRVVLSFEQPAVRGAAVVSALGVVAAIALMAGAGRRRRAR
jgi:hypothetical protein